MKAHPMRAEPTSFTLYRKRNTTALAACGGYVGAVLFLWAARQSGAQVLPDILGEIFGNTCGAILLLMSTAVLTMVAFNTPVAIFTSKGVLVGGIGLLFGYKRFIPWSRISSVDTVRVRNQTRLLIQLHQPRIADDHRRAVILLRSFAKYLNSDMNFSVRVMAMPVSEVIAELQRRFAKELRDNHIGTGVL